MITVYITNFNYGKFIAQAVDSVLCQEKVDFELFIIDDGSTDNSKEIIESYRSDPRVSIVYQQNKGLNITNNIALRLSKGDYIMRLDADDYLEPDALFYLASELDKDDELGLIFPDYYIVDAQGEQIERHHRHDFKEEVTLYDQAAHGACTMIRTKFLKSLGGYNESYRCQDGYELWVKFIQSYKVKNLNIPLFSYRQHGENLTSNQNRILNTRARINADFIDKHEVDVSSIAIIPIRTAKDKYCPLMVNGVSLLNKKIQQACDSKNIKKVVLACYDEEIVDSVAEPLRDNDKFVFVKRSEASIQYNVSLSRTITEVMEAVHDVEFNTVILLDVRFPLITAINIDDAINTMHLFNADSLISVRSMDNIVFQHDGTGMKPIMNQDEFTKLEREQLYTHVGGITVLKKSSFLDSKRVIHGKVGHMVLNKTNSFGIEDQVDLALVEILEQQNI